MLLDPITSALCAHFMKTNPINACQSTIQSSYIEYHINTKIDTLQKNEEKRLYDFLGKTFVYSTIAMVMTYNDIQQQEIIVKFPMDPMISSVSFDLTPMRQSYALEKKWQF